jgi:hypothetical protein
VLSDTGCLEDDFALDLTYPPVMPHDQPPLFHVSLYPGSIVLKHEDSESSRSHGGSRETSVLANHIVDTLFGLLKVAAWSDKTWENGPEPAEGDLDEELPDEWFEGPGIAVSLGNKDLAYLAERVSQRGVASEYLSHFSYFTSLVPSSFQILHENTRMSCGADFAYNW